MADWETNRGGICRDCLTPFSRAMARCPACQSPRTLFHPELFDLSIAHIDCDAFYAAIEKRDNPSIRDKPVIIGGGRRGVVSTACYIARIHGVKSAMPMFKALKACPDAVVIKPNMAKYVDVGRDIRDRLFNLSPLVEPLSIDEAFIDLSGTDKVHRMPPAATLVKFALEVEREVGITVSVGLAFNKFLAKVGSDQDKPRGFFVLGQKDADAFLKAQKIDIIWGVGKSFRKALEKDGLRTIADLRTVDRKTLISRYGQMGDRLFALARGDDSRTVTPTRETKSVSNETTFNEDISSFETLNTILWHLSEKVSSRLKANGYVGRTVTLKLKDNAFKLRTRSATLDEPTQLANAIHDIAKPLLDRECDGTAYRLIGIGLSGLSSHEAHKDAPALFTDKHAIAREKAERAVDDVRSKFGSDIIKRGIGLGEKRKK